MNMRYIRSKNKIPDTSLSLAHMFGGFIHDTRQNNFLFHLDKDKYPISYNKHDSDQSYNNGIFFSLYKIPANIWHNPTCYQNLAGSLKLPVSYVPVWCCCLLTYVLTDALSLLLVSCFCEEVSEKFPKRTSEETFVSSLVFRVACNGACTKARHWLLLCRRNETKPLCTIF